MSDSTTSPLTAHYLSTTRESSFRAIWQFRRLLLTLAVRDLKVKYQRSTLGLLWTLLNPLLMVLVIVAVFTSVLRIRVDGFWAFLISGIFAWQFISESMTRATSVLRSHAGLRRSVAFPSEIVVLSSLLAKLVEFLIEIAIVMTAIFVFFHHGIPATVILLPYLILLQTLMAAGLMFALSAISVLFYDVEHALPAVTRLLFYLTPIFYPYSMVPDVAHPYYDLNPFVSIIRLYRAVLYEGVWPSWTLLGAASAIALAMFILGYWIFQQLKEVSVEIA